MLLDPLVRSETMLFFMFQQLVDAPQDQVWKCFVHESDISNGPEVCGGSCVFHFWKHLEHYFIPRRWYFPRMQNLVHDAKESCHNIVWRKMQQFSHQPTVRSFVHSRLMAPFNSCKLQLGSVKCNGRVGLPGCPWNIFSNMSAKSFAGGCCAHCRMTVCDIFCSIFHWFGMFNNCWSLEDFHARSSRRCNFAMSKDNCFFDWTFNCLSALSAQVSQCIGGFIFASCLFAVTTLQPSIKQFLLKPWQVLRVVNVVGIDMLQPYMTIWYKVAMPSSSGNGFQCLRVLLRTCLLLFGTFHVNKQCTHRWSNPMDNMLSFHTFDTAALSSAMIYSNCTRASWNNLSHVQLSLVCWLSD